jgi:hypothetical protein
VNRWTRLLHAAEALDARPDEWRLQLESLLETFDAERDPVDDYEGYVVRRLLLALLRPRG